MSQRWDDLIVLDACRFDFFHRYNFIKGRLYKVATKGTTTNDWLKANFPDFYPDTVYVSGNPHISNHSVQGWKGSEHFAHVEEVHSYAWDRPLGTVRPRDMVRGALRIKSRFPDFRMIAHFMQPHEPYLGETRFAHGIRRAYFDETTLDWTSLRKAYRDNLLAVLREIHMLIDRLEGNTVITSDHGELLGEYFLFHHWRWLYVKELAEIPWLQVEDVQ